MSTKLSTKKQIRAEKWANLAGLRSIVQVGAPVELRSGREWRPPRLTKRFQDAWTRLIDMIVHSEEYDAAWVEETDHTFVVKASGPTHFGVWMVGW